MLICFFLSQKFESSGGEIGLRRLQLYLFLHLYNKLRSCVPLTQLIIIIFCELLEFTLTKLVSGYITCELYKMSFGKNNKFLTSIRSF